MLGTKVLAGVPGEVPPESGSDSILLRAAARVVLEAHEVAISNGGDGGGPGGGGLWMKDSALTGRADEHVLLQAGRSSFATSSRQVRAGEKAIP